jgi:hypothetical protein
MELNRTEYDVNVYISLYSLIHSTDINITKNYTYRIMHIMWKIRSNFNRQNIRFHSSDIIHSHLTLHRSISQCLKLSINKRASTIYLS